MDVDVVRLLRQNALRLGWLQLAVTRSICLRGLCFERAHKAMSKEHMEDAPASLELVLAERRLGLKVDVERH